MEIYLKGKLEDGEVVILNKELLRSFILTNESRECEIIIKPYVKKISAGQMRWYRGIAINIIIAEIENKTGEVWSHEDIHAYNVAKIMKPKVITREILGETIIETSKFSMKDMTRPQFDRFKNELQHMWALKDIDIPDPNEENFLNEANGADSIRDFKRNSTQKD